MNQPSSRPPEVAAAHAVALGLLAQPPLPDKAASLMRALPEPVVPLLWRESRDGPAASPQAFVAAGMRLAELPADLSPRDIASAVETLGDGFRQAPLAIVAKLAERLRGSCADRATKLEAAHIAAWAAARRPHMTVAGARARDWQALLDEALAYRHDDELALRRHPRAWTQPLAQLRAAGMVLTPITSTEQLLAATDHCGALTSSRLADRCEQGLEAWWLLKSAFGREQQVQAAVGLERDADGPWRALSVHAPPCSREFAFAVAQSLLKQTQTAARLDRLAALRGVDAGGPLLSCLAGVLRAAIPANPST